MEDLGGVRVATGGWEYSETFQLKFFAMPSHLQLYCLRGVSEMQFSLLVCFILH